MQYLQKCTMKLHRYEDDDVIDYFRKNNYDQGEILDVFLSQDFPNNENAFHLSQFNPIMNNGTSLQSP